MSQHAELIERLRKQCANTNGRSIEQVLGDFIGNMDEAADALEAQAREIEGLQAQLAATAKSAFEAMPHDIPRRMKRKICVETCWSMSLVSRAYIEFRAAFTGEKYTANEDLDAAHAENELLHKGLRQAELSMHLIAMAIDEGAPDRAKQTALLYPMTIGAVTARKLAEDRLIHTQP